MSSKSKRITAAQQTLNAFEQGYYEFEGVQVDVSELHRNTMENITLYLPESFGDIELNKATNEKKTVYSLVSLPVVSALVKLNGRRKVGILNFASAKNPGGGFLNGAQAQEESIAMCSNLYLTQSKKWEYYEANRACDSMLYTDHMIYSQDVVFIREDENDVWERPMTASVLTAPAVNMGQYLLKGNTDIEFANKVMKYRMRKILQVFAVQNNRTLILGAYGCGVFRNDSRTVAGFFMELLRGEGMEQYFEEIVFAVHDSSKERNIYTAFEQVLTPYL